MAPEYCHVQKQNFFGGRPRQEIPNIEICTWNKKTNFFLMFTVKNIVSTDDSVKRQITDSISENLTNSDLESILLGNILRTLRGLFMQ